MLLDCGSGSRASHELSALDTGYTFGESSATRLAALPTEGVSIILDHLYPTATLSLSLTNMKFWQDVLAKIQDDLIYRDSVVKIGFLQLLERDLPDFMICHLECQKLYNWRSATHRASSASPYERPLLHTFVSTLDAFHSVEIPEFVTRHAELGPDYGLQLKYFVHALKESVVRPSSESPGDWAQGGL